MHEAFKFGFIFLSSVFLAGCYVVPERTTDGRLIYQHYPLPHLGSEVPALIGSGSVQSGALSAADLPVRLYPANEIAAGTGLITGSVRNLMTGKGVFNVSYLGEVLTGEATRISNEERKGVASAFSPKGMYMSCEYQMNTPYKGAGKCTFSNGAAYQMHIGGN